ncbi:ferric reductase-like transmembrane domain-containing protein [Micromonospora sp. BL1]|uniref:ferric reductase-like transmembrane domain-containing protein n=1 Tax=Micromonospora sp. BL1 TaxID=2478709 RepID=UPI001F1EB447|nr:ferric reductase-like transmembrane domain-containing protein [Micromonospora sp. BL1]
MGSRVGRWGRRRETIEEQMARAQQNEKATTVRTTSTSRGARTMSKSAMVALTASALGLAWAGVELAGAGGVMYSYGFFFTEFFAGVVALVSLSITVMLGLLATDRLVLLIRHRVLLQSAHRATGVLGVAGLVFHVITKVAIGRAGPTDAVVPFLSGSGLYVGLGTVAALLMVGVLWTGIIRVRFAGVGPKWFWRALHSMAYVSWPFALVHGLNAGRPAAAWVVLSYLACVVLVVMALLVRVSVHLGKRSREQHQAVALNKAMAGKGEERTGVFAALTRKKAADKEDKGAGRGRWAEATATWTAPAGTARRRDPERFAVPVVPEPGSLREPVRAAAARRRDEEREPVVRARDEETAPARRTDGERPRRRRRDDEERVTRRSRTEERVSRRPRDDEDLVARYSAPPESGGRHSAPPDTGGRHSAPPDSGRYATAAEVARYSAPPRATDEPEEPWDSPRRWETRPVSGEPISAGPISGTPLSAEPLSGSGRRYRDEEDVPEQPDYWRPPARYAADEAFVDDTPTLVDLASRRAMRAGKESRSSRRKRADADAVDGAYWAGLRGEAR